MRKFVILCRVARDRIFTCESDGLICACIFTAKCCRNAACVKRKRIAVYNATFVQRRIHSCICIAVISFVLCCSGHGQGLLLNSEVTRGNNRVIVIRGVKSRFNGVVACVFGNFRCVCAVLCSLNLITVSHIVCSVGRAGCCWGVYSAAICPALKFNRAATFCLGNIRCCCDCIGQFVIAVVVVV